MVECINISSDKYKSLNDNINKSKTKLESLMNVYKYHIEYLKENFINIIKNFKILASTLEKKSYNEEMIEQFNATILTTLKSIDLINQISEREALITNFKSEIKTLKANIANYKEKVSHYETEKDNITLTSLGSPLKSNNKTNTINTVNISKESINEIDLIYKKLILKMNDMANIAELNQTNNNLLSDNNNYKSQINLLTSMNEKLKQKINEYEK